MIRIDRLGINRAKNYFKNSVFLIDSSYLCKNGQKRRKNDNKADDDVNLTVWDKVKPNQ